MQNRNFKILLLLTLTLIFSGVFLILSGVNVFKNIEQPNPSISTPIPSPIEQAVKGIEGEQAYVTKVVDGDTLEILLNGKEEKVRMVGIDTPETKDPRRPVGCFGKEASSETKSLLQGKTVILQKDITEKDKYGRLLRYVYLPLESGETLFVNDYLVRSGFAKVYTYPPDVKYNEQFLEAQRQAREQKKGLWGSC